MSGDLTCRYLTESGYHQAAIESIYLNHSDIFDLKTARKCTVLNKYIIFNDDFKEEEIVGELKKSAHLKCLRYKECKNYTRHESELCSNCRIIKCEKHGCLIHFIQDKKETTCHVHTKKKYTPI